MPSRSTSRCPPSALPVVTRVKPSTGPTGGYTAVTISGRNFAAYSTVRFGSNGPKCLSTKVVSSTTITCLTPPHVVGTVHVHVITPGGTSVSGTTDRFTYK